MGNPNKWTWWDYTLAVVVALLIAFMVYGCVHIPSTVTLRNPETGQTITLSQNTYCGYGVYAIGPAIAKRTQQHDMIEAYKAQGFTEVVYSSKRGL